MIVQVALRQDLELSPAADRAGIIAKVASLKTRADAARYLAEVAAKRRVRLPEQEGDTSQKVMKDGA